MKIAVKELDKKAFFVDVFHVGRDEYLEPYHEHKEDQRTETIPVMNWWGDAQVHTPDGDMDIDLTYCTVCDAYKDDDGFWNE